MLSNKPIQSALISVFNKDGLEPILQLLHKQGVTIYSTGGTQSFIEQHNIPVNAVEDLTSYPSILGGRVKTLHPKVFGAILARRENEQDQKELAEFEIPLFDLVIVDLYPFEDTLKSGADHQSIIEKIDIGGISLIRAAAKNYTDVVCIPSKNEYAELETILSQGHTTTNAQRRSFSAKAFAVSSNYDHLIGTYLAGGNIHALRYGENPHQEASFQGNKDDVFEQIHGKELSYNNLLDVDATLNYLHDFDQTTVAIIKHNNACGLACGDNLTETWKRALAGDPVSAFGGIIGINKTVDLATAQEIDKIFFEVILAPDYNADALEVLKTKKNRVILKIKNFVPLHTEKRSLLNGVLVQEKDLKVETAADLKTATTLEPTSAQISDLLFANKIVKNSKSNTIVLAKNGQLLGLGCGMTSRVDALKHAITKAKEFELDLNGAVMSSDAFFPFPDCVEIAHGEGIKAVIQPGGSIKDQDSIDYCNLSNMAMVFTGTRHFKH
ncbi:MAG: bifunctional phosphoribosylaminoimidazolecarboxamide formyltransferase/IMP cyclohydrolase [Bacteroidetes bacterium]|nr:bifunctional phosphoribosylaminoimidazolecarboxamide formyltransferase/IMP cyclohydrolase [Bacteroidota bacterium]